MKNKNNKNAILIAFFVMFIASSMIASQAPSYLDDWFWKDNWGNISYAGRFIGNFFTIILNGPISSIFVGLFKGFTLTLICFFVCLISGEIKLNRILLFNCLFLLINLRTTWESFLWTSGFVNYMLPFIFVTPVVLINSRLKLSNEDKNTSLKIISLICIFLSTFFLENLSTTMIIYLFTELILGFLYEKRNLHYRLLSLFISIFSFLLMIKFSVRFSYSGDGRYSLINFHTLKEFISNLFATNFIILKSLFYNNVFFWIIFTIITTIFFLSKFKSKTRKDKYSLLLSIQAIILILCPTYQFLFLSPDLFRDRVVFPSFMIAIIIAIKFYSEIDENLIYSKSINKKIIPLLILCMIFPTLFFIDVSIWNHRLNLENQKAINGNPEILYSKVKPKFDNYYLKEANGPLIDKACEVVYKKYYGIPENTVIK